MAELRKQQLIEAGLIPNISSDANEEGEEKKGSYYYARKRKAKKDKVQEEGKDKAADSLTAVAKD